MAMAPNILIVDDHPLFRDALETALSRATHGAAQAVHAGSIQQALDCTQQHEFHLVLLDLNLADANGFDGFARLQSSGVTCPIIVVSATETDAVIQQAKTLGASGYLPKSLGLEALATALSTVLDGVEWFPETKGEGEADADSLARVASLTPAQKRVINGLSDGLLNKQIAYEMGISEATVKAHMTAIFRKLGANNRTQALLLYKSALGLDDHSAA